MTAIARIRSALFDPMDRSDWLLPSLARVTFLAVFFFYFLASAGTKTDGGLLSPSAGAFAQIFPKAAEAVLYDVTQLTGFQRLAILVGTLAEYTLPVLIVLGLFTRPAALAMIGFVIVQTVVDVTGHGVPLGAWFNTAPELIDERALWVFLLVVLVVKGAGPISIDRLFKPASG